MQKFHPNCSLNVCAIARGKPAKYVWSVSILLPEGNEIISAKKFCGITERNNVEFGAIIFALQQALRLQRDKLEMNANFPLEGILEPKNNRVSPKEKAQIQDILDLWGQFRLRRYGKLSEATLEKMRAQVETLY